MKIDRVRQLESVTDFGQETSLIRDVLDNLELEQSLTWLLEAINTHLENGAEKEPWHLYQTTLFAMYVDYDNGQVRLSRHAGLPRCGHGTAAEGFSGNPAPGRPGKRLTRAIFQKPIRIRRFTAAAIRASGGKSRNGSRTTDFIHEQDPCRIPFPWADSERNQPFFGEDGRTPGFPWPWPF